MIVTARVLNVGQLRAWYGRVEALHGVDLQVRPGQVVALLGPNGAGKTTTMRSICGAVRRTGSITYNGIDIARSKTSAIARAGVGHVPEGRGTFTDLTVADNLKLALVSRSRRFAGESAVDLSAVYDVFPRLRDMSTRKAGRLSGGEQQMLAVGRALLGRPRLLLIDEPSTGLAPKLVSDMYAQLRELFARWDTAVLIAEQDIYHALQLADYAYVLASGRVVVSGPAGRLAADEALTNAYLGDGAFAPRGGG